MSEKKVVLLGAGLVTQPLVDYLLDLPEFHLTIATRTALTSAPIGDLLERSVTITP